MNLQRTSLKQHLVSYAFLACVLSGFLLSYLLFFIYPVFLDFAPLPDGGPKLQSEIGGDLRQMLDYSKSWFILKQTPYIGNNLYPPLTTVLFTPLLMVEYRTAYTLLTMTSVVCYLFIAFFFPFWISRAKQVSPLLFLFLVSGLFSHGFQFELRQGQFNLIAMFFCWLSLWLYYNHHHSHHRYLAYLFFSLSIQLKVYPAIFVVLFITDWYDWKKNLKKVVGLGLVNFALLFVLGIQTFVDFLAAIKAQAVEPFTWFGNHSIRSAVVVILTSKRGSELLQQFNLLWLNKHLEVIQLSLLALVVACILLILWQTYRHKQSSPNPYLILGCTLGTLLIPPVSHDYKLSLLTGSIALAFYQDPIPTGISFRSRLVLWPVAFLFFLIYSFLLFPQTNRPPFLNSNMPALMVLLLAIVLFSWVTQRLATK